MYVCVCVCVCACVCVCVCVKYFGRFNITAKISYTVGRNLKKMLIN